MKSVIHRRVLHNDEIRDAGEAFLAAGQVGLLSGWGVFTTIRVHDGVLFAFERHWARLSKDAALLHVQLPAEPSRVQAKLLELVEANQAYESTLRMAVVRNDGSVWQGPGIHRPSDLIALTANLKNWGGGVKLSVVSQARHAASMFSGTKILSWAMNLTWVEEAQRKGFDEVILLNERGEVSECTSANIFIARGTRVLTPPLTSGCLPGITRDLLLNETHVPGWEIAEQTLTPADLESADEVFITSTTRELLPVIQIENRPLRNADRGRKALQRAFSDYVDGYVSRNKVLVAEK